MYILFSAKFHRWQKYRNFDKISLTILRSDTSILGSRKSVKCSKYWDALFSASLGLHPSADLFWNDVSKLLTWLIAVTNECVTITSPVRAHVEFFLIDDFYGDFRAGFSVRSLFYRSKSPTVNFQYSFRNFWTHLQRGRKKMRKKIVKKFWPS